MNEFNITGKVVNISESLYWGSEGVLPYYLISIDCKHEWKSPREDRIEVYCDDGTFEKGQKVHVKGCIIVNGPFTPLMATEIKTI